MATWKIPVTWSVGGCVYVTAETLEEAVEIAKDKEGGNTPPGRSRLC